MDLKTLGRAAIGAGTLVLLGALTVVNASAASRHPGKRLPEQPSLSSGRVPGHVGVDDVLRISVGGEPASSGRYRVTARGDIDFPFVGRLAVSGLTPAEVAKLIADGFKKTEMGNRTVSVEIEAVQKVVR